MSEPWCVLAAFLLGAIITNIHWAFLYNEHLRDDCEKYKIK